MQMSDITFVLTDVVDHYYMVIGREGGCSITKDRNRATVFNLVLAGAQFTTHPAIPEPFLTDNQHAWRPVYIKTEEKTDGR